MSPKITTELLKQLRQVMKSPRYVQEPVQAYIVPSGDAHQVWMDELWELFYYFFLFFFPKKKKEKEKQARDNRNHPSFTNFYGSSITAWVTWEPLCWKKFLESFQETEVFMFL